jgi:hypothetical protein
MPLSPSIQSLPAPASIVSPVSEPPAPARSAIVTALPSTSAVSAPV